MNTINKIYEIKEYYVDGYGWIGLSEYSSINSSYDEQGKRIKLKITQVSAKYINSDTLEKGQEDFSLDRWHTLNLKDYQPELRTFKEGRGAKLVADKIVYCGWFYGKRKNIVTYMNKRYAQELVMGYKITW